MAHLLVASPCGFVTVFDLTHKIQSHNQKHRQNLAVKTVAAKSCSYFTAYLLSPVLLHSQAARDACLFRLQSVRSSLIASSIQPFSHRRFFPLYESVVTSQKTGSDLYFKNKMQSIKASVFEKPINKGLQKGIKKCPFEMAKQTLHLSGRRSNWNALNFKAHAMSKNERKQEIIKISTDNFKFYHCNPSWKGIIVIIIVLTFILLMWKL